MANNYTVTRTLNDEQASRMIRLLQDARQGILYPCKAITDITSAIDILIRQAKIEVLEVPRG